MPKAEVGRVSIRVLPDIRGFRRKLDNDLRRAVSGVKVELPISAKLDDADLRAAIERAESIIRGHKSNVQVGADLDNDDLRAAISNAEGRVKAAHSDIRVGAALAHGATEKLRTEVSSAVERAEGKDVEVGLDVRNPEEFKARLRVLLHDIDAHVDIKGHLNRESREKIKHQIKSLDDTVTVNVDLDKGKAMLGMAVLTRPRFAKVIAKLDKTSYAAVGAALSRLSGARLTWDFLDKVQNKVKNLDKVALKFGAVSTAVLALGSQVLSLTGAVGSLGAGFIRMFPALLVLPGMMGAAAVGVGVLVVALKDIKDRLGDLKPQFEDLGSSIQDAFWGVAEGPIRDLVDVMLPALSDELTDIAAGYGGWAKAISEAAIEHTSGFEQSFKYMGEAINIATQGVHDFASGIMTLGEVGAEHLPGVAEWFNRIAERFKNWAESGQATGHINDIIEEGKHAASTLWDATKSLGGIFESIFMAMERADATSLDHVADSLERMNQALKGPIGQQALEDIFTGAARGFEAMKPGFDALGRAVAEFAPTLGNLMETSGQIVTGVFENLGTVLENPKFQSGIQGLFDGLKSAVESLGPAMGPLGDILGNLASLGGTLLENFGPVLASVITDLAPAFETLTGVAKDLSDALSGPLKSALDAVLPFIADHIESIVAFAAAIAGVATAVNGLSIVGDVLQALGGLASMFGAEGLGAALAGTEGGLGAVAAALGVTVPEVLAVVAVVAALVAALVLLWQNSETFRDVMTGLWDGIVAAAQSALEWFQSAILPGLTDMWNGLVEVFNAAWEGIQEIWDTYGPVIVETIMAAWDAISPWWDMFWNGIKTILEGVWTAISGVITGALEVIKGVINVFVGVLTGNWSKAWDGIKQIVSGVWEAIKSLITGALDVVKGAITTELAAIGGAMSGGWAAVQTIVSDVWEAMKTTVSDALSGVVDLVGSLPGKASSALSDLGSTLIPSGQSLIQGFIDGIKSKLSSVTSAVSSIVSSARSYFPFSPAKRGPFSGKGWTLYSGRSLIEGFAQGVEDREAYLQSRVNQTLGAVNTSVSGSFDFRKSAVAGEPSNRSIVLNVYDADNVLLGTMDARVDRAMGSMSRVNVREALGL